MEIDLIGDAAGDDARGEQCAPLQEETQKKVAVKLLDLADFF